MRNTLLKLYVKAQVRLASLKNEEGEFVVDPYEVDRLIGPRINCVIKAEEVETTPSSVVSLVGDVVEIVREGKGDVSGFR